MLCPPRTTAAMESCAPMPQGYPSLKNALSPPTVQPKGGAQEGSPRQASSTSCTAAAPAVHVGWEK